MNGSLVSHAKNGQEEVVGRNIKKNILGVIQIIRDTLGGEGGFQIVSPNDTGGRGCFPKCHVTFFSEFRSKMF